jgi:hypothetical protein
VKKNAQKMLDHFCAKLEDSFKNAGNRTSTDVGPVFQVQEFKVHKASQKVTFCGIASSF